MPQHNIKVLFIHGEGTFAVTFAFGVTSNNNSNLFTNFV